MPMESMGACLVANDLPGLGKEIIDRRVQGQSWKQIGQDLKIGSPGTARKTFTKITGITDYKIKGQAVKALAKQVGFLDDAGELVAHQAIKTVTQGLSSTTSATTAPKAVSSAKKWDPVKSMEDKAAKAAKTTISDDVVDEVLELSGQGKGYTFISQKTGLQLGEIDDIVWNDLLGEHDYEVWKAYVSKPTSQSGGKAVKELVQEGRALGLTTKEIADLTSIPESVVKAVINNTWTIPTHAGATAYIPGQTPASPSHSSYAPIDPKDLKTTTLEGNISTRGEFSYAGKADMDKWEASLPRMTSEQLSAMRSYTGSGYHTMNNGLRNGGSSVGRIKSMEEGMKPIPFDVRVERWTGGDTFNSMGISPADSHTLVGKVFEDPAFLSTSIKQGGVFTGRSYQLIIDVPKGTEARWVGGGISGFGMSEAELILQRGTPMLVTEVKDVVHGSKLVRQIFARVL